MCVCVKVVVDVVKVVEVMLINSLNFQFLNVNYVETFG